MSKYTISFLTPSLGEEIKTEQDHGYSLMAVVGWLAVFVFICQ